MFRDIISRLCCCDVFGLFWRVNTILSGFSVIEWLIKPILAIWVHTGLDPCLDVQDFGLKIVFDFIFFRSRKFVLISKKVSKFRLATQKRIIKKYSVFFWITRFPEFLRYFHPLSVPRIFGTKLNLLLAIFKRIWW